MKKVYRLALMASLLGMFTVSCQKEEGEIHTSDRFKLEMAPFTDANGSKIYLQFGDEHSTLIYEEGDHIQVNGTVFTIHKETDGWYANGTTISADKFYAAYVDGTLDNWSESAHTYGFNINSSMDNNQHNKVILAGTSDDGTVLTLQPACAIVRLNTGNSGSSWTNVKIGFDASKILKKGTLNPETKVLSQGATGEFMDACRQGHEGDMLAMRWSKQGSSDYVGDENGYWYVAIPIEGNSNSVTTKLYLKWTNGGQTTYFQTKGQVELRKGYVYTLGTDRQSPFSTEGYSKYFFNVDASHLIAFSAGNLQCQKYAQGLSLAYKWKFAENQYDAIGTSNNLIDDLSKWFDLFGYGTSGWSASGATAYAPSSYVVDNTAYGTNAIGETNADWGRFNGSTPGIYYGTTLVTSVSWRTLSRSEWNYLISRPGKSGIVCIANTYYGLMLLPNTGLMGEDEWTNTTDVNISSLSNSTVTSLSESDWVKLENIGAIFLPCAGTRTGKNGAALIDMLGQYWTSNQRDATRGRALTFSVSPASCATSDSPDKHIGSSVRLVANVGW